VPTLRADKHGNTAFRMNRYHRQMLLPQIGATGQDRLAKSRAVLIGCGALGCLLADQLVRAGLGHLRIVDRDVVELTNLQRQTLFDEADARNGLPKAVAAANRLRAINSEVVIEPVVLDLHAVNAEEVIGADLILDGTDNAETRYLLNDVAVKKGVPWVYGACVGMEGRMMAVRPGRTPCLRCLFPTPPAPGSLPTCDTSGILGPVAAMVASMQATAAIQLLIGAEPPNQMMSIDGWGGRFHATPMEGPVENCPACARRRFDYLAQRTRVPVALCGRNAVQVQPAASGGTFAFEAVASKLKSVGQVERTPYLLRCTLEESAALRLTLFTDGRMIVHGTTDLDQARSIYARYVGS
jgi:molybdopterin-synthase adenylyltransferase